MGMLFVDFRYVSDHTRWMAEQEAKHPEWAADRRTGRAIWWDRPQSVEAGKAAPDSSVPVKPYAYDSNF